MISPRLRRALHAALDLVLDTLNEDERERAPKRRTRAPRQALDLAKVDPVTRKRAEQALERLRVLGG